MRTGGEDAFFHYAIPCLPTSSLSLEGIRYVDLLLAIPALPAEKYSLFTGDMLGSAGGLFFNEVYRLGMPLIGLAPLL